MAKQKDLAELLKGESDEQSTLRSEVAKKEKFIEELEKQIEVIICNYVCTYIYVCLHNYVHMYESRLMVASCKAKKKQHVCTSSSLHDHYSDLFTRNRALKFANAVTIYVSHHKHYCLVYYRPSTFYYRIHIPMSE